MNFDFLKLGPIKSFLFTPSYWGVPRINFYLLFATFWSTYLVGGPGYSICIIIILLAHEMGHFIMCRRYHVEATWPFFLPFPSIFGTIGAVIKMKGPIPNKRALFDIGAAGPIGGLIFAIPITFIGLYLSEIHPIPRDAEFGFGLGEPILFAFFAKITLGNVPEGFNLVLSPMAYAGWVGLFVTALNLLPIGQLDGGHIIYALLGKHSNTIFKIGIGIFCIFSIFLIVFLHNPVWLVFAIVLLLIGFKHPAPIDPFTPLDFRRKCIGVMMLIIFLLSFTPIPLQF